MSGTSIIAKFSMSLKQNNGLARMEALLNRKFHISQISLSTLFKDALFLVPLFKLDVPFLNPT